MTDTTIDTNALIERLDTVHSMVLSHEELFREAAEALRTQDQHHADVCKMYSDEITTLTAERDEFNRLYKGALLNVQTSVAHAADLNAQLENYQEKAQALHKYLGDKNVDGIEAVITEFSLMAEQEGNR